MIRYGWDLYRAACDVVDNIGADIEYGRTDGEQLLRLLDQVVAAQLKAAGVAVPLASCECDIVGDKQGNAGWHEFNCNQSGVGEPELRLAPCWGETCDETCPVHGG